MLNLILSQLHESGHTTPPKLRSLCLEVIAVSGPLAEESKMNVHTCTPAYIMLMGREGESSGESTSKLTDASCALGEEKIKGKYCSSPACTPILFEYTKERKKLKTTNHWMDLYL